MYAEVNVKYLTVLVNTMNWRREFMNDRICQLATHSLWTALNSLYFSHRRHTNCWPLTQHSSQFIYNRNK